MSDRVRQFIPRLRGPEQDKVRKAQQNHAQDKLAHFPTRTFLFCRNKSYSRLTGCPNWAKVLALTFFAKTAKVRSFQMLPKCNLYTLHFHSSFTYIDEISRSQPHWLDRLETVLLFFREVFIQLTSNHAGYLHPHNTCN